MANIILHGLVAFLLLASAALVADSKLFGETAGSAGVAHLSSVSRVKDIGNSSQPKENETKTKSPSPSPARSPSPSPSPSSSSSSSSSPSPSPSSSSSSSSSTSSSPSSSSLSSSSSSSQSTFISYAALKADSVPCNLRGSSYYNCNDHGEVNPYSRGCSCITRCAREVN